MSFSDMPTQSVAQPIRLSRDAGRERSALDLTRVAEQAVAVERRGRRAAALDASTGSTQMKFGRPRLGAVDLRDCPSASVTIPENGVVSARNSGTWNVPCTSRTPLVSVTDVTVYAGA